MTKRLVLLFVLSLAFVNPYLRGDGNGYYAWLRSPLIDRDVDFGNEYLHADPTFKAAFIDEAGRPAPQMRTVTGKVENQWSSGPAVLWLPAFTIAHALARLGVGVPDGFSPVYLWLVALSTAIYGFLAVVIGVDLARRLGHARWAVLAGAAVLLASPLPVYMYILPFHVHALAAFSTALFFWWGFVRVRDWRARDWAIWGLCGGLMLAVYYVQALFLAAVAWRLLSVRGSWRERVSAGLAFGAGVLPFVALHLLSRYALYGSMLTTGYRDQFFFNSPRLLATAFSREHGLFLWSPVIALALAGLVALARRGMEARVFLAVWALLFYVIASFQNWHGQSSFGNRFFLSLTVAFVLGVAAALAWLHARHRAAPAVLVAALVLWNAGFMFQWGLNIVPNRGPVSFAEVARNQVTVVPARFVSMLGRYFRDRRGLTREIESGDLEERERYRLRR